METSGKLATYLASYKIADCQLYIQSALATICVCSCKHNSTWVASHIHTCTNETHSMVNLQDIIPTLDGLCCLQLLLPK